MTSPLNFEAKITNGVLNVKPIIERKGKDLIIHIPSLPLIHKLIKQHKDKNGKRNIQQI